MTADLKVVEPPESKEVLQKQMVQMFEEVLESAKKGEFDTAVIVMIRPDRSYAVWKSGTLRKLETVGYLEDAKLSILIEPEA